jgi:hypothetical protein
MTGKPDVETWARWTAEKSEVGGLFKSETRTPETRRKSEFRSSKSGFRMFFDTRLSAIGYRRLAIPQANHRRSEVRSQK